MTANPPLGTLGRIVEGEEAGRFVEVLDDLNHSGGYLICTYADDQRSHEPFDSWVETYDEVNALFFESNWTVEWADPGESSDRGAAVTQACDRPPGDCRAGLAQR
jgi:hypothetical protein